MSEDSRLAQSPPPPVKVLAAHLRRCHRVPGGPWLLDREEYRRPALAVSLVWLQGTVLAVEEGGSTVRLRDDSGPFVAQGVEKIPKGRPCLSAGKYVMVMGLVVSCSPEPTIRAVKMTDLSGNPLHRDMWQLEVEDLHRYDRAMEMEMLASQPPFRRRAVADSQLVNLGQVMLDYPVENVVVTARIKHPQSRIWLQNFGLFSWPALSLYYNASNAELPISLPGAVQTSNFNCNLLKLLHEVHAALKYCFPCPRTCLD